MYLFRETVYKSIKDNFFSYYNNVMETMLILIHQIKVWKATLPTPSSVKNLMKQKVRTHEPSTHFSSTSNLLANKRRSEKQKNVFRILSIH